MELRANFAVVTFLAHLGNVESDLDAADIYTFVGNQTPVKDFRIERKPVGKGYITLQLCNVHSPDHRIKINGQDLSAKDLPLNAEHWFAWFDIIDAGILKQGDNTIQIVQASRGDNFLIGSAIINWREEV